MMKPKDVEPYMFKDIKAVLMDGSIHVGFFGGFESQYDSSSGKDEIEILVSDRVEIGIPIDEIESIEIAWYIIIYMVLEASERVLFQIRGAYLFPSVIYYSSLYIL